MIWELFKVGKTRIKFYMKNRLQKITSIRGQALVEALVAIGITMILVTGLIAGTVNSLKSNQFGRNKSQASKLSQEGLEVARALRDGSWEDFVAFSNYPASGAKFWCLDGQSTWAELFQGQQCPFNILNVFNRKISFNWQDPKMVVVSTVSWNDASTVHKSEITTYFTKWR